jgi:hypothetical protein
MKGKDFLQVTTSELVGKASRKTRCLTEAQGPEKATPALSFALIHEVPRRGILRTSLLRSSPKFVLRAVKKGLSVTASVFSRV